MTIQLINKCKHAVGKVICGDIDKTGSGFFVDDNGLFLTNNHVVTRVNIDESGVIRFDYSSDILVKVGKEVYQASIANDADSDEPSVFDYSILNVDRVSTDHICIANISQVNQGEQVFAIGYPSGFEIPIVTSGVISAILKRPSHRNTLFTMKAFLTDAVATYGNSGGPLVRSIDGKVIGIVTLPHEIRSILKERLREHRRNATPLISDLIEFILKYLHEGFIYAISIEHVLNDPAFPRKGGDS